MSEAKKNAKLLLLPRYGHDEDMFLFDDRGLLSHVFVEIDGTNLYPVHFYTPDRIVTALGIMSEYGQPFVAEIGMILVPEIDIATIENVVQQLADSGYFEYLVPMTWEQVESSDPMIWPPKL